MLRARLDQPSVRLVLHENTSAGMLNYAQKSKHAECDNLSVRSLIILTES